MKTSVASVTVLGMATVASAHPIQKVIDQMVDLRIQAKEEAEAETVAYTKFNHWCGNEIESLQGKIANNNDKISGFKDAINGAKASIESLKDEIQMLEDEIAKRNGDQAKADELRGEEKAIYDKKKSDLEETISAIVSATATLKESKSVLQIKSSLRKASVAASFAMSNSQKKTIHAFLQEVDAQPQEEIVGDPTKAGNKVRKYDFKSGSVIELLEGLSDDFKATLLETEKAETNAINGHELASQAQTAAITAATGAKDEKSKILADTEQELADAETDLGDEERDLDLNQTTLKETTTDCQQRAEEFASRSASREGEQKALSEAVAILSKVTGLRNPLTQEIAKKALMFLQFSKENPMQASATTKAVDLISVAATKNNNGSLKKLAQQVRVLSQKKGAFKQIKNMIQKMIFRLNKEQQDEDAHKNWCDTELETTQQQRDEKNNQVEELTAKKEMLISKINTLKEALEEANQSIADTNQYMKDETELRSENKADNNKTIEDSKEAQAALAAAIGVLTKYYKDSGSIAKEDWEFIQQPALEYSGSFSATDGSSAVMSLLEVCLGDYSKMEAEATATEESEEANFEEDMKTNKIALAKLNNEVKVKTARKTTLEGDKASTEKLLKQSSKQLEALDIYLNDLVQPCQSGDSSYDDRKSARASEVDALKNALNVLADAFKPKSFLAVH